MMRPIDTRKARPWDLVVAALAAVVLSGCASHPKPAPRPLATSVPSPGANAPSSSFAAPTATDVQSAVLPGSTQDFVINVGDRIYFDYDRAELRADARPVLSAQATWLQRYPDATVRIEGNCDERGTREYNFALGAKRADAVRQFLVDHGVMSSRVTTVSYGEGAAHRCGRRGRRPWR